jgi:hypothetical protein
MALDFADEANVLSICTVNLDGQRPVTANFQDGTFK